MELAYDALDLTPAEAADRFRAARRAGRPAWLWPEVAPAEWRSSLLEIGRVAARLLAADGHVERLSESAIRDETTLSLAAYTSGTGPLLGWWLERGRLEAPPAAAAVLALHLRHARARAARLEEQLARAVRVLGEAGIVPALLKGAHTARRYFAEPALRPAADLDVLVRGGEIGLAERALRAAGFVPGGAQRRPFRSSWLPSAGEGRTPGSLPPAGAGRMPRSLLLAHADDAIAIDLHASLDRNMFGVRRLRFDRCVDAWDEERVAGVPVRLLPQPWLLLYLACHASEGLHQLTLIRLVELAAVIRRDTAAGRLRWEDVSAAAAELRCERFCYPAMELAGRFVPGLVPGAIRARLHLAAPPRMRRVVAAIEPATAQRIDDVSLGERLMWASGPVEHARRAVHALWPPEAGWSVARGVALWGRRAWLLVPGRLHR